MDRDIYIRETEAKFNRWEMELARMKAEVDKIDAEARQPIYIHLALLRENVQEARNSFERLRASDGDMWRQRGPDFDTGMERVESGFEDARQSFRSSGINLPTQPGAEGWPEGQGEITGESEGWSEGQGETPDNSIGWSEGQAGKKINDTEGWPEGQQQRSR
jgi:hypothetical protein